MSINDIQLDVWPTKLGQAYDEAGGTDSYNSEVSNLFIGGTTQLTPRIHTASTKSSCSADFDGSSSQVKSMGVMKFSLPSSTSLSSKHHRIHRVGM